MIIGRGELYTAREMRAVELNSAALGFGEELMMENAGSWAARAASVMGNSFTVLVGKGGKGGDGLVAARRLALEGKEVKAVLPYKRCELKEITRKQLERAEASGVEVLGEPEEAEVIIDALLGTGSKGVPRGAARELIEWANSASARRLAIDIPSGMEPDSGRCELCFDADLIVTMHKPKPALAKIMEIVVVADIGIPEKAVTHTGPGDLLLSPRRGRKGQNGRVAVVGGSGLYQGAPWLSALAAFKSGADLVFVYSPSRFYYPELLWRERRDLKEQLARDRANVVLVGPGLGEDMATLAEVLEYAEESGAKLVLDADALKLVPKADVPEGEVIMTPHLGEAKRLLGKDLADTLEERIRAAEEIASTYGACVVLKGPVDVVHCGDKGVLNETGNEWMTVGGTGDVLAGTAAAFLARDEPWWAAKAAAYAVGRAGELCYEERGRADPECLINSVPKVAKGDPLNYPSPR
ncbi:MAG: NAD(P)H-hydrate dehydratase [Crenarchaeota archaeon]|nr:NAD(P)H-hydrate dehydratase [Thermoproteota archaeon]